MPDQESNKEVVRSVEDAWASGDLDSLDQYFASDYDNSGATLPGLPPGLEGAKMAHQGSMKAFPDRKTHIEDVLAEGNTVVVRGRYTGTNQGGVDFLGIPGNGKPIDLSYVSFYRLQDGKIVGHWALNDAMALMQQLGALPSP
jgi:predicted ester cyclase